MTKSKELTKVSMFYDKLILVATLIGLLVVILGNYLNYIWDTESTAKSVVSQKNILWFKVALPIVICFLLFCLRRRRIDKTGVFATYFGIRYKSIKWDNMQNVKIELVRPRYYRKDRDDLYRNTLVFTSKPKRNGKCTVIMIAATEKARTLVEKYYGQVDYIQEGVSFDVDNLY